MFSSLTHLVGMPIGIDGGQRRDVEFDADVDPGLLILLVYLPFMNVMTLRAVIRERMPLLDCVVLPVLVVIDAAVLARWPHIFTWAATVVHAHPLTIVAAPVMWLLPGIRVLLAGLVTVGGLWLLVVALTALAERLHRWRSVSR